MKLKLLCASLVMMHSYTLFGGDIRIDGSSTVYPIAEALAEEFQNVNKSAKVSVGTSGTGGGMKKFIAGEIDIANASRPIKEEEIAGAKKAGIEFLEIEVAIDGLAVVVHKNNPANSITIAELKKIWEPAPKGKKHPVTSWKQVNAAWPDKKMRLYGPGTDSGTFDYFTEVVVGKSKASRDDYTASEEDNMLVNGVAGDESALGYFGFSYYTLNSKKLKALAIDAGKGPIAPTIATIENGTYAPLSRPLFIYVSRKSAERKDVKQFVEFALAQSAQLASEVGYVPLPPAKSKEMQTRWSTWINIKTATKR
jgi:phosphate transport system substrate-binding protein